MSEEWPRKPVGHRIAELPKSVLPAGRADEQGAFPFFCSSTEVKRIDLAISSSPSILMGTGGVATVHLGLGPHAYSTDTWAFTVFDAETDLQFLYRQLEHQLPQIDYAGFEGSGLRHLQKDYIRSLVLLCPPKAQQLGITKVLATLDTAIYESEAIIAKLKYVKQGLLHDLLTRGVDPNGELRPQQAEAAHFYKPSSTGWIPNDWISRTLNCWLESKPKNGYSPQEASEWTGIQMLGLGCLTAQGFQPLQLKPAPRGDKRLSSALLSDGDLLMSRANTRDLVGMVGVYRDVGTPCTYPDLMMRLRPSTETSAEFLQFVLQSSAVRRQVQAHAVGTSESMVKISGKIVSNLVVAIPSMTEQSQILALMSAGDARLNAELEKVAVLRELKAGLMDDLLTGRVRVTPLLETTP